MKKRALYPGTFDPITHGHSDLIRRASQLFDEVIVAVADSQAKKPWLELSLRLELAQEVLKEFANVRVQAFSHLLVDFAREQEVDVIVRGLRAVTDFEYEYQLVGMNRRLDPNLETVFLPTAEQYSYISASLVREIASLGGDVTSFVDQEVAKRLPCTQQ